MKKKPVRRRTKPVVRRKAMEGLTFTYKETGMMTRFITEQGSILPRAETGLSQKQQRQLAREIKRARHLALLPFTQTL